MKKKLIISYELGYHNWYVSEFYKYFHSKLIEESDIELEYITLSDLSLRFGKTLENHKSSMFNWYNLVIYNPINEIFFIHSWYDYAPEILNYCRINNFNVVKFSCVSNLSDNILNHEENNKIIQPSVYYLENWSDINFINSIPRKTNRKNKSYFNGLNHGYRDTIMRVLSKNPFFDIRQKSDPKTFRQKDQYYEELSEYNFGLSLNGAANICYRDLELFGMGVLNLRQPLNSKTFNPLREGIHYIEFLDEKLTHDLIYNFEVEKIIDDKVNKLLEFSSTSEYNNMIDESINWFNENCTPKKQYEILVSFFNNFDIFF